MIFGAIGRARAERKAGLAAPVTAEAFVAAIPTDGPVLEIGPFVHPRLTGPQVRYLDVLDQARLNARAEKKGLPPTAPPIDFVSEDGDLAAARGPFQALFGAHVLEHQIDLIGHLKTAEALLAPGGRYFLIVPDKRYCFDHFLPESTLADALDAHLRPSANHTLKSLIAHRALTTHNSPARHWRGDHGDLSDRLDRARVLLKSWSKRPERRHDVHAWQFTPESFKELIEDMNGLGLVGLKPAAVHATRTGEGEFFAVLQRA
ncbi:MAG: hypothetical protein ACXW3D_09395 [Caulobacteraceae bacterium]